ncbi:hypothetical protein PM082_019862 [Marasmius tenuissimus]|nr:hypothetical protein PM082_019862 [Marasmius tenuissimus]
MFFADVWELMTPHYTGFLLIHYVHIDLLLPVEIACLYLDDPVGAVQSWLSSEQVNDRKKEREFLDGAMRCYYKLEEWKLPQDIIDKLYQVVTTHVENHVQKFDPSVSVVLQARGRPNNTSINKFRCSAYY